MTRAPDVAAPLAVHELRTGVPARTPFLLLPGFPLDGRMWRAVADALPPGRRVVTPDPPGLGEAPDGDQVARAVGAGPEPSIATAADAVAASLTGLGIGRVVVVGLSMGGYVAMALVERHPELVAGLGLVDTKSTADEEAARANRLRIADEVLASGSVEAVRGMRTTLLGATARATRPDLVATLDGWISSQPPAGVAWSQRAMAARPDRTAVLAGFAGPAAVVVGAEDELASPATARLMADALPDATFDVLDGAGHMSSIERPTEVAALLDALARRADRA